MESNKQPRDSLGARGGGGEGIRALRGLRLVTMERRIPAVPGRGHVEFSPTRQTLLAPSAKRGEVFGESH